MICKICRREVLQHGLVNFGVHDGRIDPGADAFRLREDVREPLAIDGAEHSPHA